VSEVFEYFRAKDYFGQKTDITWATDFRDFNGAILHKASVVFCFNPFPISGWRAHAVTEDNIFDMIEFLHEHISKPVEHSFPEAYLSYDSAAGQAEFRQMTNDFLCDYKTGFEIAEDSAGGSCMQCAPATRTAHMECGSLLPPSQAEAWARQISRLGPKQASARQGGAKLRFLESGGPDQSGPETGPPHSTMRS
jgi:hypothetical protein